MLYREATVGLLLAVSLCVVGYVRVVIFLDSTSSADIVTIGVSICSALFIIVLGACVFVGFAEGGSTGFGANSNRLLIRSG